MYTYSGLRLTNATPGIVRLIDPEGAVIDQTSPFKDEDNDEKTWQRFPDGGDPLWPDLWFFIPATQGPIEQLIACAYPMHPQQTEY